MKVNFIIRSGRIMDPATATDQIRDVAVSSIRIIGPWGEMVGCDHVIDTSGCTVAPGFIDFHTHIFYEGSGTCLRSDFMISQGATAAVDAGTAGTVTYETFYESVITQSTVRIKSFPTTFSGGQLDLRLYEDFDPCLINLPRMEQVIDKYRGNILGFKIRLSKGVVPDDKRPEYLKRVIDLAEELDNKLGTSLRIHVHATNIPITAGEPAQCLRPRNIFCRCCQGAGNTIATEGGGILPLVLETGKLGVTFDAASGRGNFGVDTARQALAAGLLPDIISSGLTLDKLDISPYAKDLLLIMAKYRTLGMELMDTLRAVAAMSAKIMGIEGKIGTLKPGADADIVTLKQKGLSFTRKDFRDEELISHKLLVLQMAMCAGEINFCQPGLFL